MRSPAQDSKKDDDANAQPEAAIEAKRLVQKFLRGELQIVFKTVYGRQESVSVRLQPFSLVSGVAAASCA